MFSNAKIGGSGNLERKPCVGNLASETLRRKKNFCYVFKRKNWRVEKIGAETLRRKPCGYLSWTHPAPKLHHQELFAVGWGGEVARWWGGEVVRWWGGEVKWNWNWNLNFYIEALNWNWIIELGELHWVHWGIEGLKGWRVETELTSTWTLEIKISKLNWIDIGILGCWDIGILGYWNVEMLGG